MEYLIEHETGDERGGDEFKSCEENESWISFAGIDLNLEIKNQSLTLVNIPSKKENEKLICSGKLNGRLYGIWSDQGQGQGLSTSVLEEASSVWNKVDIEMTISDRENPGCVFHENIIYICGGWSDRHGSLASCEYFDGTFILKYYPSVCMYLFKELSGRILVQ